MKEWVIEPQWPAPPCIKAYTTLRSSGIGVRQTAERTPGNVNRPRLKQVLNLPANPIWLNQTHSTIALPALTEHNGQEGDAVFTQTTQQVCAVLTADCLPLLICHRLGTHVAAIHAGWRGLAQGVIEATLQALQLPPEDILVWLGPAIGPTKFEIRKDVYDSFTQAHTDAATAFQAISDEQWLGDLYQLARLRLHKKGITHIYGGEYCTYSDQEQFYSFRRDGEILGSNVNLIWIEK